MEDAVRKVRSVLISVKQKSDLKSLESDFKMLLGEEIPYKKLGYSNLEQFLREVDSLRLSNTANGVVVEALPLDSSKHMVQLVSKQKTTKKKTSAGSGRLPSRYISKVSPRFHKQEKKHSNSPPHHSASQSWRASFVGNAKQKPHVHQIVVNENNNNTKEKRNSYGRISPNSSGNFAQQRLLKSLRQSPPPTNGTPSSENTSRKVTMSQGSNLHVSLNQNAQSSNIPKTVPVYPEVRTRMRSHVTGFNSPSPTSTFPGHVPRFPTPAINQGPNIRPATLRQTSQESITAPEPLRQVNENNNSSTDRGSPIMDIEGKTGPIADLIIFTRAHNLPDPIIKIKILKERKNKDFFICSIKVENQTFSSYPKDCPKQEQAELVAVQIALTELSNRYSNDRQIKLLSTEQDVLTRIPQMIEVHFGGIWAKQLALDYEDAYNEQLPPNWLSLIDTLPTISVEPMQNNGFILKNCKIGEKTLIKQNIESNSQTLIDISVASNKVHLNSDGWLVQVTFIASTIEVWCRRIGTDEANRYCDLSEKMQNYYSTNGQSERATNVVVSGFYVLLYEGCWSRVRVIDVSEHNVTCFFIDYGDEQIVPRLELYELQREFAKEPAQAFVCRLAELEELANIETATNQLECLAGKTYWAKPQIDNDVTTNLSISIVLYEVTTDNEPILEYDDNVNNKLMYEIASDAIPKIDSTEINKYYLTHVNDDGDLYVQPQCEAYNLVTELISALENINFAEDLPGNHVPQTSEKDAERLYVARWTQKDGDGQLYRARICDRSPDGQYICLFFIDFGNTQIVDLNKTQEIYPLEKISSVLCAFPPLAFQIRMDVDVKPGFAQKASELMPADKPIVLKVLRTLTEPDGTKIPICEIFRISETNNNLFAVSASLKFSDKIRDDSEDSNNNNKTIELANKLRRLNSLPGPSGNLNRPIPSTGILASPEITKNNYFDVCIPFAVNPWNFFVQPYSSAEQLKQLMKQLQERYTNICTERLQINDIVPGNIYASQRADGVWYRTSVIKVINSGSISVFYCDFGYYDNLTVKQLVPLDRPFLSLPHQAMKARLAGIQPKDAKWSVDDCRHFECLVLNKTFVSLICAVQQDELYPCDTVLVLKLIDTSTENDIRIDELLISRGIAAPAPINN